MSGDTWMSENFSQVRLVFIERNMLAGWAGRKAGVVSSQEDELQFVNGYSKTKANEFREIPTYQQVNFGARSGWNKVFKYLEDL